MNAIEPDFTPRVVWLSSSAHLAFPKNGGIDWDSFHDASNSSSLLSYGQSKAGNIYQAYIYGQQNKDVISIVVHPGYLRSELSRNYNMFQNFILRFVGYPTVFGSYTELFAGLSPEVTIKDSGRYVGPWGNFRELREDIHAGLTDGTAQKFWDWADKEVEAYA